jgi:flagellar protein FlaG
MGMQISSLFTGSAAIQRLPHERRPPLPMEKKVNAEQAEIRLPGSQTLLPELKLKQTASELEQISRVFNRRLQFVVDQESKEIIVKVIDNETDKVIKILPPEELQRAHSRIRETFGFLIDRMI